MCRNVRKIRCPDCYNFMFVTLDDVGGARGYCNKCNAIVIGKHPSDKERYIRILKR
jgi:hypothetical protein